MLEPVHKSRVKPQETLELIRKLRHHFQLQEEDFELFHHWGARGKLNTFVDYCNEDEKRLFQLNGNNHRLHLRLEYALVCCQNGNSIVANLSRIWQKKRSRNSRQFKPALHHSALSICALCNVSE
jgi:hypothetical protein